MDAKERFDEARAVAIAAHGGQMYGDQPYAYHLQAVVDVLTRFGARLEDAATAPLLVAAWLHDSLEDTALTFAEIEARFGAEVAELVWRVTDEPGATREERKPATYLKTRESAMAVVLKLADRIANVEASLATDRKLVEMYRREHAEFRTMLHPAAGGEIASRMWTCLDALLAASGTRDTPPIVS